MKAQELLDEYIDRDYSVMKSKVMGVMIEIPYYTIIHLMEHYETIKRHEYITTK